MKIEVQSGWDGLALGETVATFVLEADAEARRLSVEWWAPMRGDPPPPFPGGPQGRYPKLWNYEVAELFLIGEDEHYLELEFNPHGYWLAIQLHGPRQVVGDTYRIDPQIERADETWGGRLHLEARRLPPGLMRVNAFAIYGQGEARRYCAHVGGAGGTPDFHRLALSNPIDPALLSDLGPTGAAWR
jgi:hypothetical protein